jgi:uncharacterized integral membrane protein (TIGR00697 family)
MQMKVNTTANTKFYNALTLIFVFCLFISNIAEMKIIDILGVAQVGAGTLFFPLLYVLNDVITEIYGFSASRRTIWLALCFNLTFTVLMYFIMMLPEGEDWQEKEAFEVIFALSPRIMLGSLISYFLGELINSSIISSLKLQLQGRLFALRAVLSTLISSFIESILFGIIAFYGRIPDDELVKMTVMLTILKVLYEIAVMPFTIMLVNYLKKVENLDVYEKPLLKNIFPSW